MSVAPLEKWRSFVPVNPGSETLLKAIAQLMSGRFEPGNPHVISKKSRLYASDVRSRETADSFNVMGKLQKKKSVFCLNLC